MENDPFCEGAVPPKEHLERKTINVHGRKEHEAIVKDTKKCQELGLDRIYETMVYLKRWGSWLDEEEE